MSTWRAFDVKLPIHVKYAHVDETLVDAIWVHEAIFSIFFFFEIFMLISSAPFNTSRKNVDTLKNPGTIIHSGELSLLYLLTENVYLLTGKHPRLKTTLTLWQTYQSKSQRAWTIEEFLGLGCFSNFTNFTSTWTTLSWDFLKMMLRGPDLTLLEEKWCWIFNFLISLSQLCLHKCGKKCQWWQMC